MVRAIFLLAIGSLGIHSSSQAQSGSASRVHPALNTTVETTNATTAAKTTYQIASVPVSTPDVAHVVTQPDSVLHQGSLLASTHSRSRTLDAINFSKPVSLLNENILNVRVDYDVRPVGGILSVRVSIAPAFRGIGVSTRPAISRSVSMAVDEVSDETVQSMIAELTEEIQTEFISMDRIEISGSNECPALMRK